MNGDNPAEKPESSGIAKPGLRESFLQAEAHARDVLRSRGLSELQIDRELQRAKRDQID